MVLFEKKQQLSRREFRKKLRKSSSVIPGTGGSGRYNLRQRAKMEKEIFGKRFGSHISKMEFNKRLRELKKERLNTLNATERTKIDRKIRYLGSLIKK